MNQPTISIITPVYNSEKYLRECIESVINQTSPDWELILVDDGSTDDSGKICDEYAQKDQRIKAFHKANSGQLGSRLLGVKNASGVYCTGLDSDDYLEPDCIEKLTETVSETEWDVVCWKVNLVDDKAVTVFEEYERIGEYSGEEFLEYTCRSSNHSFCNKMIRTELLQMSQYGTIPEHVRHSEDFIMICPSLCMAKKVLVLDDVLYNYRQVNGSVTHTYTGKRVLDYLDSEECIEDILQRYGALKEPIIQVEKEKLFSIVAYSLKRAYADNELTSEEVRVIRGHCMYKSLKRYEKICNTSMDSYVFMKLFRHRADVLLRLIWRG